MPTYTREIIDRRQPSIRWSAVFAGTAVAGGIWILLQVFGMGAGLAAVDTDNAGSLRGVSIGTTVWSLLAPLIAMFIGGYIAGKLANFRDDKLGALHGVVVWALTSVLGVLATVSLVSALAAGGARATALSRADTDDGADHVDHRADMYDHHIDTYDHRTEHAARAAADATGKALLAGGTSLLLSLGTALLGGLLAVRGFGRNRDDERHTTMQTPVVPPPPGADTAAY